MTSRGTPSRRSGSGSGRFAIAATSQHHQGVASSISHSTMAVLAGGVRYTPNVNGWIANGILSGRSTSPGRVPNAAEKLERSVRVWACRCRNGPKELRRASMSHICAARGVTNIPCTQTRRPLVQKIPSAQPRRRKRPARTARMRYGLIPLVAQDEQP